MGVWGGICKGVWKNSNFWRKAGILGCEMGWILCTGKVLSSSKVVVLNIEEEEEERERYMYIKEKFQNSSVLKKVNGWMRCGGIWGLVAFCTP